jgi:HSP20 family protein
MAIVRKEDPSALARSMREWDPFHTMRELMRWDPFSEMTPLLWHGKEERMPLVPAFDVRETKDAYVFKADLPGFR